MGAASAWQIINLNWSYLTNKRYEFLASTERYIIMVDDQLLHNNLIAFDCRDLHIHMTHLRTVSTYLPSQCLGRHSELLLCRSPFPCDPSECPHPYN